MNDDCGKYEYSGYDIGFDARLQFSWLDGSWGKNVVFRVNRTFSVYVDNKKGYLSSWWRSNTRTRRYHDNSRG